MPCLYGSTNQWSIAWRGIITISLGAVTTNVAWFLLWPATGSGAFPVAFSGAGIGTGIQAQPYVIAPFTSFKVMSGGSAGSGNCILSDFNSFGSIFFSSAGAGGGTGAVALNFYSVDHSPNPINCSGAPVGAGAAGGWTPGRFSVLEDFCFDIGGSSTSMYSGGDADYVLADSSDSLSDLTDAIADYLQNNTDPTYQNMFA